MRMPEETAKLLREEADKRGIAPSTLACDIVTEALNGPGVATCGRSARKKALVRASAREVFAPKKPARSAKTANPDQTAGYIEAIKETAGGKPVSNVGDRYLTAKVLPVEPYQSISDRMRQKRPKLQGNAVHVLTGVEEIREWTEEDQRKLAEMSRAAFADKPEDIAIPERTLVPLEDL
jgi:hypothetical protein